MKTFRKFSYLLYPFIALVLLSVLLLIERYGVVSELKYDTDNYLSAEAVAAKKSPDTWEKECLLLLDATQENSTEVEAHLTFVLESMRIGYTKFDMADGQIPDLSRYRTVVIGFPCLDVLSGSLFSLFDWVENGGRLMLFSVPEPTPVFQTISRNLGIVEGGMSYARVHGLKIQNEFMLGSENFEYHWEEPSSSMLDVRVSPSATVYVVSDDKTKPPLLWKTPYGQGYIVVNNHGMCEKITRGLTAAAYSLLEDLCVYPVINTSCFFLDDFPSPVPGGDGTYIRKYFGRDIASFYSNIWWPDMLQLADKYSVKYTGLIIEDYSETVTGPFPRTRDLERFRYFGNMLLEYGGELGLHGYNHMPLCLESYDFKGKVDYKKWKTPEDMEAAIRELLTFSEETFPNSKITTYVPPSNILSEEGRAVLAERFPQIRTLASLYLVEEIEYEQEFCISEDGIVELPRVISGTQIDAFMYWAAINELNFHYVNSHFMHPDDVLDVDRGAAKGWNSMRDTLDEYMSWLYGAAPNLRNQTSSEASGAVSRYDVLSLQRNFSGDTLELKIDNFNDEAYFMVRINEGRPAKVEGGSLEQMNQNLYILKANQDTVSIQIER